MRGFSTGGLRVAAPGMLGWLSRYYAGKRSRNKELVVLCKYNTPSVMSGKIEKPAAGTSRGNSPHGMSAVGTFRVFFVYVLTWY
jgi:hypothetical protein